MSDLTGMAWALAKAAARYVGDVRTVARMAHEMGFPCDVTTSAVLAWDDLARRSPERVTEYLRGVYPAFPDPPPFDRTRDRAVRVRLCARWPRITDEIIKAVEAIGVDTGEVDWMGTPANIWHDVIREAVKLRVHERLTAMLDAAEGG